MSESYPACRRGVHYFGYSGAAPDGGAILACTCGDRRGKQIDGRIYDVAPVELAPVHRDSDDAERACREVAWNVCCGQPMRITGMGASAGRPAWICSKCEVYQGPLGARTPAQWWRAAGMCRAWNWAQGATYEVPTGAFPSKESRASADTAGDRLNLPLALPACRYCERVVTRADLTEYQLQIWDGECGERLDKFSACSDDGCRTLADKDVGDARMNFERRREAIIAGAHEIQRQTAEIEITRNERAKARVDAAFVAFEQGLVIPIAKPPTPEQLPAIRALVDDLRRAPGQPLMLDSDVQPSGRPDGFDQAQVDAAKAVLLAQTPRKVKS